MKPLLEPVPPKEAPRRIRGRVKEDSGTCEGVSLTEQRRRAIHLFMEGARKGYLPSEFQAELDSPSHRRVSNRIMEWNLQ